MPIHKFPKYDAPIDGCLFVIFGLIGLLFIGAAIWLAGYR